MSATPTRSAQRLALLSQHLLPQYQRADNEQQRVTVELQQCCGIVGYIGYEGAFPYLVDGLRVLQSRGYDSAGVATISPDGQLTTTKFASSVDKADAIDKVSEHVTAHGSHSVGIAHTRWATHGAKTDVNAHPHTDMRGRIAVVHNGVIENSAKLKHDLELKGVQFRSETDTEVIAQLIGENLASGTESLLEATQKALSRLEGTWGLAIVDSKNPGQIIVAKNGSPMLIGISNNRMFLASEASAFSQHTKEFISLENGEVALITAAGHSLECSRIELAPNETVATTPDPHPHWTIKEIIEQPAAVGRSLNYGGRFLDDVSVKLGGLDEKSSLLLQIKHLMIAGCGTSYHAGLYGALLMRYLSAFTTIQVIDAAEMNRDAIPPEDAGVMVISQSGETKDVARALSIAEEADVPCFSVVNQVRSMIARQTGCGVYLNAGREVAVASTKAFTCQVTVLSLIATWFSQKRKTDLQRRRQVVDALHRLPTNLGMTINKVRVQCKNIAQRLVNVQHSFILGKGFAEPIAKEGALKIKEITYLHAEGYPGGALKHGPFALIEQGTPIFLIILQDVHAQLMLTAAAEVKTRGAHTIVITNLPATEIHSADDIIQIPSNGPLTALLAVIPLQLIAYELALAKGLDPDKPRNLAKAVTVD